MNHPSARLSDIMGTDEQGQLVLRIQALAYQINQGGVANVIVSQAPTTLHVIVYRHFKTEAQMNATFSLGDHQTNAMIRQTLLARLRRIEHDLKVILDEGASPKGAA